jgi:hypothetical protein
MRIALVLAATLAGLVALPGLARADARSEARKHFERAMELIDEGQMAQAVVELQRCYSIQPHHTVLYNLGQAYVTMGKPVEAVTSLERYLAEGGSAISADRRREVEQEIIRQKGRIAVLEIRGVPSGGMIRVDGKEVGAAPLPEPIRLGMGNHVVAAAAEGFRSAEQTVVLVGEDLKAVDLNLVRLPPPKVEPAPPAPPTYSPVPPPQPSPAPPPVVQAPAPLAVVAEPSQPGSGLRTAGVVVGLAGVLGLAGGAVCAYQSKSWRDKALSQWKAYRDQDARAAQTTARGYATWANVGFIAGGGLVATGVILYLAAPSENPDEKRAQVVPAAGPGFVGLVTKGSW